MSEATTTSGFSLRRLKMPLDKSRLEKVKDRPDGGYTARCPACAAESGGDSQGVHLIVFPDGKYGCAKFQGDSEHRKEVWRLAGIRNRGRGSANGGNYRIPVYEIKKLVVTPPRTILVLPPV